MANVSWTPYFTEKQKSGESKGWFNISLPKINCSSGSPEKTSKQLKGLACFKGPDLKEKLEQEISNYGQADGLHVIVYSDENKGVIEADCIIFICEEMTSEYSEVIMMNTYKAMENGLMRRDGPVLIAEHDGNQEHTPSKRGKISTGDPKNTIDQVFRNVKWHKYGESLRSTLEHMAKDIKSFEAQGGQSGNHREQNEEIGTVFCLGKNTDMVSYIRRIYEWETGTSDKKESQFELPTQSIPLQCTLSPIKGLHFRLVVTRKTMLTKITDEPEKNMFLVFFDCKEKDSFEYAQECMRMLEEQFSRRSRIFLVADYQHCVEQCLTDEQQTEILGDGKDNVAFSEVNIFHGSNVDTSILLIVEELKKARANKRGNRRS